MNYDRDLMARLWLCVSALLARAGEILGDDEDDAAFFTCLVRRQVSRFARMAEFLIRRLIAFEALALIDQGLVLKPAPMNSGQPEGGRLIKGSSGNAPSGSPYIPRWSMRLIEPAFNLAPRRESAPSALKNPPDRYALMPPNDAMRLRLKLQGLQAAMSRRAMRAQKVAEWLTTRGDDHVVPWRYGRSPFLRDKEFGAEIRSAVSNSDEALKAFIAARAGFDTS